MADADEKGAGRAEEAAGGAAEDGAGTSRQDGSGAPSPSLITRIDAPLIAHVLSLNPRCRRLNLSHNAISSVDAGEDVFPRLPHLLFLNLSQNALRALGPPFGALSRLQALDASRNQL